MENQEKIKSCLLELYGIENDMKKLSKKIQDPAVNWDETNILISELNDKEIMLKNKKEEIINILKSMQW